MSRTRCYLNYKTLEAIKKKKNTLGNGKCRHMRKANHRESSTEHRGTRSASHE